MRPGLQGTSLLALIVTAVARGDLVLNHRGEEMIGGATNREGMIAAVKSVVRHLNTVVVRRLVSIGRSVCLHRGHLLVVTAARR